ncbi:Uncharacterised protein [Enterobacter hormaechei]|nr:Uncharacterised protein [Enterobacter hormaechei]
MQRIDNQFFHRIVLSVGFNLVLRLFAHDFYRFADELGLAVIVDDVLLFEITGIIPVYEGVRPYRLWPKPVVIRSTLSQLFTDCALDVVEGKVGGIGKEEFGFVDQAIAGAVDSVSQAGNFDLLLITFRVNEDAHALFRRSSARLIKQHRHMVKHHVGGDLVVLFALRLAVGGDTGIQQACRDMNRVGVGTGQHLIQAVDQALALVARLGVLAVNVHVARNLPVFVADVL